MLFISIAPMAQGPDRGPAAADDPPASRQIPEPSPDLTVTNLSLSTREPIDGAFINVFATVENTGKGVAEDFIIAVYAGGTQLSTMEVTSLGPGNATTASGEVRALAGILELKAVADLYDKVEEVSEANNSLVRAVSVASSDLRFSDISFLPNNFTDGENVLITTTLVNDGADTTTPFTCLLMVDAVVVRSKVFNGLGTGDSLVLSGEWTASSGSHDILAKADINDDVPETNESNNLMLKPLSATFPDLWVESLSITPGVDNITDGAMVFVEATIRNKGQTSRGFFPVRLLVDGREVGSGTINGLEANGTWNVSFEWMAEGGRHELRLDLDFSDRMVESNEGNNFRLLALDVPVPDLELRDIAVDPLFPVDGSPVTVSVEVGNPGPGPTDRTIHVQFMSDGALMGETDLAGGIDANGTRTANLSFVAHAGISEVAVIIDPSGTVPEADEGNNAGHTTIDTPFPDLSLANLSVTTGLVDGQGGNIDVTVVNDGPGNTTTNFMVDFMIDGETIARVPVEGLSVGSPAPVSAPFTARGGRVHISVRADGDRTVREADEGDNMMEMPFDVGVPDLSVEDLAWTPASPAKGELVTLSATLENLGGPTTRPVYVEFIKNSTVVAATQVDGSSLTGTVAVNHPWAYDGVPGALEVRLDSPMVITEVDETNNNRTRLFPNGSLVPAAAGPDVVLTGLEWLPQEPSDGEEVSFIVSVENQGAVPRPGPGGKGTLNPSVTILVDNEKVASVQVRLLTTEAVAIVPWVASVGDHTIRAIADWGGTILETDETNNVIVGNLTVGAPDLSLADLDFVEGTHDDGNLLAMFIQVENGGERTIRDFDLHYFVDGIHVGKEEVEGALLNRTTTITHTWRATPGTHTVTVVADPYGGVTEIDEGNNAISGTITIKRPDLTLMSVSAASAVDDGSQSLVTARVRNTGTGGTVRTFTVAFYLDGEEVGGQQVHGLPAGNDVVVSRAISPGPGSHYLRVVVDPTGAVEEADETDNSMSRPGLNVTFSDLEVSALRVTSQDDVSTMVFADITNNERTTTRAFTVAFYADGTLISSIKMDGIPGGYTTTVATSWVHGFGSHRLRAVVDPWGNIAETDEANNEAVLMTPFLSYPDLYIDEIDVVGPLVAGGELTITAMVRNIGGDTVSPFSVGFYIDGDLLGEAKVGGLPSGGNHYLSLRTEGVVGQHLVRVTVDPDDIIPERDEMDNLQYSTYTVLAPDLRVVEVQAYEHPSGVAVFAKVRNDGAHLLSPVTVSFYADGAAAAESVLRGIPALSSTTVMEIVPSRTAEVSVVADGRREVAEKIDNNNERTVAVRPNPVEGDLDIAVTDLFYVPQFPVDGQRVTFFAILENIGNRTLLGNIGVVFLVDGVSVARSDLAGLPEAGTAVVSSSWAITSGKEVNITARVEGEGAMDDTQVANNEHTTWMNVTASDLRVATVEHSDGLYGEKGTVFVKVANAGDGDVLRPFTTNLYIEGELVASEVSHGVPAGRNSTIAFPIKRSWGDKEVLAEVDPKDEVRESDEGNGRLSRLDLGYPDLTVLDAWYETGVNASTTTAFARVRNTGAGIGTDIQVRMTVNGVDLGPKSLHGLDHNSTAVLPWTFATTEITRMSASIDDSDIVPESNELNNRFERNASGNATYIPPDVNLHLISLNITQYGNPSNHYELKAVIENRGDNVSYSSIRFLADGRMVQDVPLAPLKGNSTKAVSVLWYGTADKHIFKALLDSGRDIPEYDETDNSVRREMAANHAPLAYPGGDRTVEKGGTISLHARGFDPDGRIVRYEWDLNGDGRIDWSGNESTDVRHRYSKMPPKGGKYFNATLTVTDDKGAVTTASIRVRVVEERPWYEPLPEDWTFVMAFSAGTACIAAAFVILYLFIRGNRPFKQTRKEKERRLELEREGKGGWWPPWRSEAPEDEEGGEGGKDDKGEKGGKGGEGAAEAKGKGDEKEGPTAEGEGKKGKGKSKGKAKGPA